MDANERIFTSYRCFKGVISCVFTFDVKWGYYSLALIDPEVLPSIISQHGLRGPFWWEDHSIIELEH